MTQTLAIMLPERLACSVVLAHEYASTFQGVIEVENGGGAFEGRLINENLIKLIG